MASFLELGLVNADKSVMRLIPPEIAYRYHALPVATDGNMITVAMAAPEDSQASQAIQAIMKRPICFIHADPVLIDSQLDHLWPASAPHPRLLVCIPERSAPIDSYLRYLAELLDANLDDIDLPIDQPGSIKTMGAIIGEYQPDLLVLQAQHPSRNMRRILKETTHNKGTDLSSFLVLPSRPILPIKKILLILPDSKIRSELATDWTEKLSKPAKAQVTVLPVLPCVPLIYGSFLHHELNAILAGNDQLGKKLRQIANRFTGENIQGVYKLRDGDPGTQIREEISTSQPDLIIMPSCLHPGCNTWLNADLSASLLKTLTTPMLLTSEN